MNQKDLDEIKGLLDKGWISVEDARRLVAEIERLRDFIHRNVA